MTSWPCACSCDDADCPSASASTSGQSGRSVRPASSLFIGPWRLRFKCCSVFPVWGDCRVEHKSTSANKTESHTQETQFRFQQVVHIRLGLLLSINGCEFVPPRKPC